MQVLYLETPLSRDRLIELIAEMGILPRDLLRRKGTSFDELGLDDPWLAGAEIVGAMMMHPILINGPIVIAGKGTKLCRPSEMVFEILDNPDTGPFTKEDGEVVISCRPAEHRFRPPASH
ncbi:ArsC/Spx/MgsR family protein [Rhodovulum sulfidophilum]